MAIDPLTDGTWAASLVVPTRNRARLFREMLPSLAEQAIEVPYEVIVADNGSTDDTVAMLRDASARWPHVRFVEEPRPGAGRARHTAALSSRSPILIFLDDDMVCDPGLVAEHLRLHAESPGVCVLGNVRSAPRTAPFERMLSYIYDGPRITLEAREPDVTDCWAGHMSLSRALYLRLGGFDDRLADCGGEDLDFGMRMIEAGVRLRFAPAAMSYHHLVGRFGPRLRRAYINGVVFGHLNARYPSLKFGTAEAGRSPAGARAVEWLCRSAAAVLEPFDRGPGVPIKPLAFVYDLGLRTATGRGTADYASGRARSSLPSEQAPIL